MTMPRHHKKDSAPGGSQRQLRVGETVRHAVAEILSHGHVSDPDLENHIVTVPEVRMSPDLKLATVYVMPLGGRDTELVIAALERNGPDLDTEKLVQTLENFRDYDIGLGTLVTFGRSEHQGVHKVWGTQLDANGRYQPIDLQ